MQPFTQSKNEMKTRTHKRKNKQFCIMRLIPFHQNHRASGKRENITILPTVYRLNNFKQGITKSKTERRMNFKLVSFSRTTLLSSTKFHYDQMQFLKGNIWSSRPFCNISVSCKKMVSMPNDNSNIPPSHTVPFSKNETARVFYLCYQKMQI